MKLALFSPFNPQKSGISDYTEELLPYLAADAEIDLYVDGFEPTNPHVTAHHRWFDYRNDPATLQQLGRYDAVLYHIGNDHRYHTGIYQTLCKHPGIIVFHDFALQDFFLGLARASGSLSIYLDELEKCYGEAARRESEDAIERGLAPPHIARCTEFPLNERVTAEAEGIIIHSEWSRARFERIAPGVPLARISHHIAERAASAVLTQEAKPNAATVALASFGLITAEKGIERVLRALAALDADYDFQYTLVGEPNRFFDVRERVRFFGLSDRVKITGHVTLEEFERYIAQTDIALNLRERTVGETSGSLCRVMAAGVAAIVSNVGWFAELPDDSVAKIDCDEHADALLIAYLRRLIEDVGLRASIGANARRYMHAHHAIEKSARGYLSFIREIIARRARRQFIGGVAHEIAQLGLGESENFLAHTSARIAELAPSDCSFEYGGLSGEDTSGNGSMGRNGDVDKNSPNNQSQPDGVDSTVCAASQNNEVSTSILTGAACSSLPLQTPSSPPHVRAKNRLPKIEGIDYVRAAIEYPLKLDAERRHYLLTKPFYNLVNRPPKHRGYGMDAETHRHFCDFANMAVVLQLAPGARILDVGCGSGWLSEYFARLGYDVTGIDVSPDLVRMAHERLQTIQYGVDHETPLRYRFKAHNVESSPLDERFDAAICYDSLHHFVNEERVMQHLATMLPMGGKLFILEGNKPPQNSATEAELIGVMRDYGTLESPFDSTYLRRLLRQYGFAIIGDYIGVNALFERETLKGDCLRVNVPEVNYLLCRKVAEGGLAANVPDSRSPGVLRAQFAVRERNWNAHVTPNATLRVTLTVENTGDTLWLGGERMRRGVVMLGVKIIDEMGHIVDEVHGEPSLPRSVGMGEKITLDVTRSAPSAPGAYRLQFDLVSQEVCWFEECGSKPLVLNFDVLE